MPTTSIRWAAVNRLVELIRAQTGAESVVIEPGWPGDQHLGHDMLFVGRVSSAVDIPVFGGTSRTIRDDRFDIALLGRVVGRDSLDSTMQRVDEIAAFIDDAVADNDDLDGLDGCVSVEVTSAEMDCGRTPDGCIGYLEYVIQVHSRLN